MERVEKLKPGARAARQESMTSRPRRGRTGPREERALTQREREQMPRAATDDSVGLEGERGNLLALSTSGTKGGGEAGRAAARTERVGHNELGVRDAGAGAA